MLLDPKKFSQEIKLLELLKEPSEGLPMADQQRIKQNIMRAINAPAPQGPWFPMERLLNAAKYLVPAVLGLTLIGGTALAANNAKPGDILYPVKIATEQIQLKLTVNDEAKAELQAKFAQERLDELKELADEAPKTTVVIPPDGSLNFSTTTSGNLNLQISGTGSSSQATVTVITEGGTGNNNNDDKFQRKIALEVQASNEAKTEVNNALDALTKVRQKLQDQGNASGAASILQSINSLKLNAGLIGNTPNGTSTPPTGLRHRSRINFGGQNASSTPPVFNATGTTNIKINFPPQGHGDFHIDLRDNSNTGGQSITAPNVNNQTIVTASSTSSASVQIHQNFQSNSQSNFQQIFNQQTSGGGN